MEYYLRCPSRYSLRSHLLQNVRAASLARCLQPAHSGLYFRFQMSPNPGTQFVPPLPQDVSPGACEATPRRSTTRHDRNRSRIRLSTATSPRLRTCPSGERGRGHDRGSDLVGRPAKWIGERSSETPVPALCPSIPSCPVNNEYIVLTPSRLCVVEQTLTLCFECHCKAPEPQRQTYPGEGRAQRSEAGPPPYGT